MASDGIHLLLKAASFVKTDYDENNEGENSASVSRTPTVARYEEISYNSVYYHSFESFSELSFINVASSTPIVPALDLSVSCSSDTPLDLSVNKIENNAPMNLALKKIQVDESTTVSSGKIAALNLVVPWKKGETKRSPFSEINVNTSIMLNQPIRSDKTSDMHHIVSSNVSNKRHADQSFWTPREDTLGCREIYTTSECVMPAKPTTEELHGLDTDSESGNEHEESEAGDPTLLNDFTLNEYFEPFRNEDIVEEELDDASANHCDRPIQCEYMGNDFVDVASLSNEDNTKKRKGESRRIYIENRKRKHKGLEYHRINGTKVPARRVRQACNCSKRQCNRKYSEELRTKILKNLLKLSPSAQNQFLSNHVTVGTVSYHRVVNSRRTYSRKYFLPGVGGLVRVCKLMYLATFDVKEKKVRGLAEKKIAGFGVAEDDRRSENGCRIQISEETKQRIENHIRSFPAYTAHYSREKTSKLYLSSDLSVAKMHDLYLAQNSTTSGHAVHYNTYRKIFNSFNFSFRKPRSDTCGECDKLNVLIKQTSTAPEKEKLIATRDKHQAQAKSMYELKKKDVQEAKKDNSVYTASFDLQKCLPTPHLLCGQAFYSRQLYTLNLTVFETFNEQNHARCYLWDETIARRGSQEIGSCLLRNLDTLLKQRDANVNPIKVINLYSDRCGGQNHNIVICMALSMFTEMRMREGLDLTIRHNFMTSGHSHMEVDTVHAAIERAKKRNNMDIETPRDWAVFISQIRRKVPMNVVEMQRIDFLSLKNLAQRYKRPKINCAGERIQFKKIRLFEYRTNAPGVVFYKTDEDDYNSFVFTEGVNDPFPNLLPIESEPISLAQEKLEDLKRLLPFIKNKQYYQTLLKNMVPAKPGRKKKSQAVDHFEADLDGIEDDWPVDYLDCTDNDYRGQKNQEL